MPPTAPQPASTSRARLLEGITAPLGFFVLALLIVETFLGAVLIGAKLESAGQLTGMWLGASMFVLVVLLVFLLVWFKPENILFTKVEQAARIGILPATTPSPEPGPKKPKRGPTKRKSKAKPPGNEGTAL